MVTSWHPDPQKTTWINPAAAAAELAMAYLCTDCVDIPALGGVKKPEWPIGLNTRDGHADADIRINFRIIRQYRAISDICRIYPTYASMRIAKNIRMAIPTSYPPSLLWTDMFKSYNSLDSKCHYSIRQKFVYQQHKTVFCIATSLSWITAKCHDFSSKILQRKQQVGWNAAKEESLSFIYL